MSADGLSPPRASRPSSRLDLSQRPQVPPFNPSAQVSTLSRAAQRALCGGAWHRTRPHATACGLYMPRVDTPTRPPQAGENRGRGARRAHMSQGGDLRGCCGSMPKPGDLTGTEGCAPQVSSVGRYCTNDRQPGSDRGNARFLTIRRSMESIGVIVHSWAACIHGQRAFMGEERGTSRAGLVVVADRPLALRVPHSSLSPCSRAAAACGLRASPCEGVAAPFLSPRGGRMSVLVGRPARRGVA